MAILFFFFFLHLILTLIITQRIYSRNKCLKLTIYKILFSDLFHFFFSLLISIVRPNPQSLESVDRLVQTLRYSHRSAWCRRHVTFQWSEASTKRKFDLAYIYHSMLCSQEESKCHTISASQYFSHILLLYCELLSSRRLEVIFSYFSLLPCRALCDKWPQIHWRLVQLTECGDVAMNRAVGK